MTDYEIFCEQVKDKVAALSTLAGDVSKIDSTLYDKYEVKRGLRDINGKGVVAGLTKISDIQSSAKNANGESVPCEGKLFYRGIAIEDIVDGFVKENRYGFEEVSYLLLFGDLPTTEQLDGFKNVLGGYRSLPLSFVRDIIMKRPSVDMMNVLQRCVLSLYPYDENPEDLSVKNTLRQGLELMSELPLISVYGYQVFKHFHDDDSLIIHRPKAELSTAENILHMLRPDSNYTQLEAKLLDMCLVLHAEHGGGNNSTFTTHVVSSSGTDTYSSVSASLGSLKGPKHGGANIKVVKMIEDMSQNLKSYSDEDIKEYLNKILSAEVFDKSGLIYGMGHAVYSISDPRANILRKFVYDLAREKGLDKEFSLYEKIERLAPEVIGERRKIYKGVSANIDFYSGFVYSMLGLPVELFTPIFAISRIVGWTAHRIEELVNGGKIIRPAYSAITPARPYVKLENRCSGCGSAQPTSNDSTAR